MSERSFRSPSPHGERRRLEQDHPPVPAIPPGHKVSRSTSSAGVGMQNFKTASQKMETGLPSWYTQPQGDPSNVRTSDAPMRRGRQESITSVGQRPDSRSSSVNFSYPGRARTQSPPASPIADHNPQWGSSARQGTSASSSGQPEPVLVYDPNSRRMVPKPNLEAVSYQVKAASEKPQKSTKSQSAVQGSGSRLSKGTVARVKGSIIDEGEQSRDLQRREQPVAETRHPTQRETQLLEDTEAEAVNTAPQATERRSNRVNLEHLPEPQDSRFSTPSPVPHDTQRMPSPRPGGKITRKPSVVQEDPEEEFEEAPAFITSNAALHAQDFVPKRQTFHEAEGEQIATANLQPEAVRHVGTHNRSHPSPETAAYEDAADKPGFAENKAVAGLARNESSPKRSASQSPARHARFAPGPSEGLVVRHAPLGRSISPIKSALKHSGPSPRDGSPADNVSRAARLQVDSPEQDAPAARKKSVRVSFDERSPLVVGESHSGPGDTNSPVVASPQSRRPWYGSIGRNKKKPGENALDDDEVMQPRPALPMFGSVREKKIREPEEIERPLIRPHDPPSATSVPMNSTHESAVDPNSISGPSSDFGIGSVLAQDNASRNAANISRFREPLPPVVTSVEGHGDLSDSMKSSDSEDELFDTAADGTDEEAIPGTQTTTTTMPDSQLNSLNGSTVLEEKIPIEPEQLPAQASPALISEPTPESQLPAKRSAEAVPAIAVIQPSPAPLQGSPKQYFGIPGMFPDDDSEEGVYAQEVPLPQNTAPVPAPSPTAEAIKEPEAVVLPSQRQGLPQTTLATTPQQVLFDSATDDDSNASIYSDAYEDVSDMEDGNGFQSLNAVVESPVTKRPHVDEVSGVTPSRDFHSASAEGAIHFPPTSTSSATSVGPETDWEQAKSFWRGLTTEKRRQLELEAMEDAGADGDQEEPKTPTRKMSNRTKKTAEQRLASSVVQAAQAQAAAPPEKLKQTKRTDPERTYMIQPGSRANHEPLSPTKSSGHMRASMRGTQPQSQLEGSGTLTRGTPGEVHIRKSMRSSGGDSNASRRVSSPPERNTMMTTMRPRTAGAPDNKASQQGKTASNDVAASAAAAFARTSKPTKPMFQRRDSDASDSSFKRARAPQSDNTSFRRSMRQEVAPVARPPSPPNATKGSSRFSLRSLSPSGSAFRRSSFTAPPPSSGMRHSLRSGSDSSKDSKRGSLQFPSFGRASGKAAVKAKSGSSRFGDSSDEEEPSSRFRSRFDDSSDDDDVRPNSSARPLSKGTLRGSATAPSSFKKATTPVLEEEEDFPDLPDSDGEPSMQMPSPLRSPGNATSFRPDMHHRSSSGIGTTTLRRTGSGRETLAASSTAPVVAARPNHERRSSFMSNILRRNKKADSGAKITRAELSESAARRDTNLERSTNELRTLRGDSRPTSPKLQKRNTFSRNDSWPLPDEGDNVRPNTSSGALNGKRPEFAARRSTSLGIPGATQEPNGHTVDTATLDDLGPAKKKKKFGALRRMFRLDD